MKVPMCGSTFVRFAMPRNKFVCERAKIGYVVRTAHCSLAMIKRHHSNDSKFKSPWTKVSTKVCPRFARNRNEVEPKSREQSFRFHSRNTFAKINFFEKINSIIHEQKQNQFLNINVFVQHVKITNTVKRLGVSTQSSLWAKSIFPIASSLYLNENDETQFVVRFDRHSTRVPDARVTKMRKSIAR